MAKKGKREEARQGTVLVYARPTPISQVPKFNSHFGRSVKHKEGSSVTDLTRAEHDRMVVEWIEKDGVTRLPPDGRLQTASGGSLPPNAVLVDAEEANMLSEDAEHPLDRQTKKVRGKKKKV